jgi:hypothetical protein
MKNGAGKRGQAQTQPQTVDRFAAGRSHEGDVIAESLREVGSRAEPTADEIAQRAYEKYLMRGDGDGTPEQDWLAAENELRRERGRTTS